MASYLIAAVKVTRKNDKGQQAEDWELWSDPSRDTLNRLLDRGAIVFRRLATNYKESSPHSTDMQWVLERTARPVIVCGRA